MPAPTCSPALPSGGSGFCVETNPYAIGVLTSFPCAGSPYSSTSLSIFNTLVILRFPVDSSFLISHPKNAFISPKSWIEKMLVSCCFTHSIVSPSLQIINRSST
eukprot:jgi/Botrbrau1/11917/Bobra.0259s0006.1